MTGDKDHDQEEEKPSRPQLNKWAESIEDMLKQKYVAEKKQVKKRGRLVMLIAAWGILTGREDDRAN